MLFLAILLIALLVAIALPLMRLARREGMKPIWILVPGLPSFLVWLPITWLEVGPRTMNDFQPMIELVLLPPASLLLGILAVLAIKRGSVTPRRISQVLLVALLALPIILRYGMAWHAYATRPAVRNSNAERVEADTLRRARVHSNSSNLLGQESRC